MYDTTGIVRRNTSGELMEGMAAVATGTGIRVSQDSKFMKFVERQEQNRKPHPGLWVFQAVVWAVIGVGTLVVFLAFRPVNGGRDWFLLVFVIGGVVIVPLTIWRFRRDRQRLASWDQPVKA